MLIQMRIRFRGAPQFFPFGEWYTNNTKNVKVSKYDGSIYGVRCSWDNCIIICNDDYEPNQEPKVAK